jgi:hypothetical protein
VLAVMKRHRRRVGLFIVVASLGPAIQVSARAKAESPPASSVSCGPLKPLPGGWTCVPSFGRDAWTGKYHDGQSGALVYFQIGGGPGGDLLLRFKSKDLAHPTDRSLAGQLGGVQYRGLMFEGARDRELKDFRRVLGEDYPPKDSRDEWRLPPEGARGFVVTFYKKGLSPVSFYAFVCNDAQQERVHDLLLAEFRLRNDLVGEPVESKRVSAEWVQNLPVTTRLQDVLDAAGVPGGAYPKGCDGLMLVYGLTEAGKEARLVFDRSQRLVGRELRELGG